MIGGEDDQGRWVFALAHACGHRETHRIRAVDEAGRERFPTPKEQRMILGDLEQRPCNACMTSHRPGHPATVVTLAPETEA